MNLKRLTFLALGTYAMLAVWAITGVQESSPMLTIAPRQTITLQELTPEQLEDRAEELTTTTSSTITTQPVTTLAPFDPDTKCQEWFSEAISVGWPNNTETLQKLGRLLWKETRCLNVSHTHPSFNGHDHGVAQINEIHTKYVEQVFSMPFAEAMSDPTLNLRFAFLLYSGREAAGKCGWQPWRLC